MMNNRSKLRVLLALDYYDYRLHKGVSLVAAEKGWSLVCTQNMAGAPAVPNSWNGDGIISLVATESSRNKLAEYSIPRIELGLEPNCFPLHRVIPDNLKIGVLAAEYFFQRGIRSFVIEGGTDGFAMLEQRKKSFIDRLEQFKSDGHKISIHHLPSPADKPKNSFAEIEVVNQVDLANLKKLSRPAAYFGYDDEMAMNFLERIRHFGLKVPEDFLVLGVDNNDLLCEGLDISLSSINTDQVGLGETAARKLTELINSNAIEIETDQFFLYQPKKVITRQSTDIYASSHPVINQALRMVFQQLEDNHQHTDNHPIPNAGKIAAELGLTQQGLQNIFREHFHCSPAIAIRQLRLNQAKHLLIDSTLKLKQIAFETGFNSAESLSRAFKQAFDVTPGQIRREYEQQKK